MNERTYAVFRTAPSRRSACALLLVLAVAVAVAACDGGQKTAGERVVARVDGSEISQQQMNEELARLGMQRAAVDDKVTKRVLEGLVDQQLLVQEAINVGLDRDPQVLQVMEQARRQVLSEAYLERHVTVPGSSPEEVRSFYTEHPGLFKHRRIYTFQEYTIDRSLFSESLRSELAAARTPSDLVARLRATNIAFQEAARVHAAEQLPLEILASVSAMTRGDNYPLMSERSVVVMHLVDFTEQPIGIEQATAYIDQYLINAKRKQLAETRLKELRAKARIAYVDPAGNAQERRDGWQRSAAAEPASESLTEMGGALIKKVLQELTGK